MKRFAVRLFTLLGFGALASIAALFTFAPYATNFMVDVMFANVRVPPGDRPEPPPTAYAIPQGSLDIQMLGGRGIGLNCSIEPFVDWLAFRTADGDSAISLEMRQACITHDYCYRHGAATYGFSQEDCDYSLLEDTLRLCRFTSSGSEEDQKTCQWEAKKVLLGVRLGGTSSFRTAKEGRLSNGDCENYSDKGTRCEDQFSTYFEYDPYPIGAPRHTVFRVADSPASWRDKGAHSKALYTFTVRQSGIRISTLGWNPDNQTICTGITLPGNSRFLTTAPTVTARQTNGGKSEDWFVWWQRYDMDKTGGRFVGIAPSRANLSDWEALFPGATAFESKCDISGANPSPVLSPESLGPARFVAMTGKITDKLNSDTLPPHDDNNATEYHVAPGLDSDGRIRLLALRVHSCIKKKNLLCFSDYELNPIQSEKQDHEPLLVKDHINSFGKGREPYRYRNLATPPIPLAGLDKRPVLGWIRRGSGASGDDYVRRAQFRRVTCASGEEACGVKGDDNLKGVGVGTLDLEDFCESNEPVVVLGRTQKSPRLVSFSLDHENECGGPVDEEVRISFWKLPPPVIDIKEEGTSISVSRETMGGDCASNLDDSWLVRPPLIWAHSDGSASIVFSRTDASDSSNPELVVRTATISADNICRMNGDEKKYSASFGKGLAGIVQLQQAPVLILPDDDSSDFDVLIPNGDRPSKSMRFPLSKSH